MYPVLIAKTSIKIVTTLNIGKCSLIYNTLGARHSDNGDVLLCGGRIGNGEVKADCAAYTPRTQVLSCFFY